MMDARELRRGNLITKDARIFEVIGLTPTDGIQVAVFRGRMSTHIHSADEFEGIPLSAEWLERLGFDLREESGRWVVGDLSECFQYQLALHYKGDEQLPVFYGDRRIDFVHTLQNLYHAVTGQELTPKM